MGKFDAAERMLRWAETIYKEPLLGEVRAAIRILEAAGKVDKDKARAWIDDGDHTVIDEIHIQVCNLIDALPD